MKFLQMSIHRSPCKHYLCRKTTFYFYFFNPHWTQRISTRFSSSSKWENYLKALNITSQKRETEKKNPSSLKFTLLSLQCFEDLYKAQITESWIMDLSFEMWRNTSKRLGSDCSQDFAHCADQWTIWEKVSSFLLLVGAFPRPKYQ